MFDFIDIHSHLNFPEYDFDREEVIARMKENSIATITIGTSLETSRSAVALAEIHDNIFACVGVHPIDDDNASFDEKEFEELVSHPKVVAVGECGLDYGREGVISDEDKRKQTSLFEKQIDFAVKHDKPLMIHARSANSDIIAILQSKKKEYGAKLRGNAHFFTGNLEEAKGFLELDFTLSFTGVVTFARNYDETVRFAPLDKIMSETDSPYVSPIPYRGKRNEPSHVREIVAKISQIREEPYESIRIQLAKNAVALFNLQR